VNERARLALLFARAEARGAGAPEVTAAHLLAGLVREDEGLAAELLTNHGVRLQDVRVIEENRGSAPPSADGLDSDEPPLSATVQRAVERAEWEAGWAELDHVATEHLLLGLVHEAGGAVIRLLLDAELGEEAIRGEVARLRRSGRSWL